MVREELRVSTYSRCSNDGDGDGDGGSDGVAVVWPTAVVCAVTMSGSRGKSLPHRPRDAQ